MSRIRAIIPHLLRSELHFYAERTFRELNAGDDFIPALYTRALCFKLEQVLDGEVKRLLVAMPPRHLKSHCASICLTTWALARDPTLRIICASHSADLAESFSGQARRLIEAPWHRAAFPALRLDPKKASAQELRTTQNGFRIATSVGGSLTGKGGDIIIVDDPLKAEDAHSEVKREAVHCWFTGTVTSRLDDPASGAMIVVAQRLHQDDLIGRLAQTGDWEFLELPAIATADQTLLLAPGLKWTHSRGEPLHPERLSKAALETIRRDLGTAAFEAQYQQRPAPPGGNLIKTEWFGTYGPMRRNAYEAIIQSWDTAAVPGETNDWCVCTTWGLLGRHIDLLDVHRAQHLFPDLEQEVQGLSARWKPSLIVIEQAHSGLSLIQNLRRVGLREVAGLRPKGDKVGRMSTQSAKLEAGEVRLPAKAPWLEAFLAEVSAFPHGKHDDQVDSMSQALRTLDNRNHRALRGLSRYR